MNFFPKKKLLKKSYFLIINFLNKKTEMGTKCCTTRCGEEKIESEENISKINFIKQYPIGKGGYGRVNKILILNL